MPTHKTVSHEVKCEKCKTEFENDDYGLWNHQFARHGGIAPNLRLYLAEMEERIITAIKGMGGNLNDNDD